MDKEILNICDKMKTSLEPSKAEHNKDYIITVLETLCEIVNEDFTDEEYIKYGNMEDQNKMLHKIIDRIEEICKSSTGN